MKGHIRKTGRRSHRIFLHFGHNQYKTFLVRGSKRDAERECARLIHEIETGEFVEPANMSVEDYLNKWLDTHAQRTVSAKTFERYSELVRRHLISALGKISLPKLHPLNIEAVYTTALKSGGKNGVGLSPRTVVHIHRVLHEALAQAVRWRMLARNPADAVKPPRVERKEMKVLDEPEVAKLLKAAEGDRLHPMAFVALTTGARRGELLGLKWIDVDFEAKTLTIQRSLEETRKALSFKSPKSVRGRRMIALLDSTIDVLKKHKAAQAAQRLAIGPLYEDQGLVFAQPDGKPWRPSNITLAFAGLVRRAKVTPVRFHDLRHTHASLLLKQGVHPKVVSERLGHASIAITLDLYSHVLPGLQEDAAQRLDSALKKAGI